MSQLPPGFKVVTPQSSTGGSSSLPSGFNVVTGSTLAPQTPREKAKAYLDAHPDAQPGTLSSLANKVGQGFTFGFADEAAAGLSAIKDTIKHGGSLRDNYDLEHAMQQELLDRAGKKTGAAGIAAEVVGGIGSGLGAAKNGVTLLKAGQGLLPTVGRGAAEGAIYGGLTGAGTADQGNRLEGAAKGAGLGAVGGAVAPAVVELGSRVGSGALSGYRAWRDPRGFAQEQLAKTVERSGRTAADLQNELLQARQAGQGNYVLADALGDSGQKQLAGAVKLPGSAKQTAIDELAARNSGMGRQVGGFVDEAFNTHGNTAQEYIDLMEAARSRAGDVRYDAARASAGPVDLNRTLSTLEDIRDPAGVLSNPTAGQSVAPGGVERAAQLIGREGVGPTDAADFSVLLDTKRQIGDISSEAQRAGRNYEASQVGRINSALDSALSDASPGYRRANDTFSRMSRPIEAVEEGQRAAVRGRSADTINTFNQMERPGQQGFRVGYADKLNEALGGSTVGRKLNDMLVGDAADEIAAIATPGKADLLNEQLQRARTMVGTGNQALGGSPTAELLGQQADLGATLPIMSQIAQGNILSAAKQALSTLGQGAIGEQEAVRNNLIPMLMSKAGGLDLNSLMQAVQASQRARQTFSNDLGRGAVTGILPAIMSELGGRQPPSSVNVTPDSQEAFVNRTRLYGGR
jgi:hypothetical protein